MKKILLFALLLLSSCADALENITIIDGVDADQYLGTWYEIARLDHPFERGLDNVTTHYELEKDGGIKITSKGFNRKHQKWDVAVGEARFLAPKQANNTYLGKLSVAFNGSSYGRYNIIELDKIYYNYAMVCGPNKKYLWILARTPELTYPIKQHLMSKANELGFDTDSLIHVNQNPDIPNYEAGQHVIKKRKNR
ncbi:MAG: lipocalin family protein [Methylophilaceae bacterium]